ncbi:hypothetical protein V8G54_028927 [Vigna mungo]|uniref:Uncharacterized protein n=1 Tax=Vigna mungo TaxID=3915 RepID=A0AAQ3RJV2_VIGMU
MKHETFNNITTFNRKILRAKKVSPFSLFSPSSMPYPLTLTVGSVSFLGFPHSLAASSTEEEKEEEEIGGLTTRSGNKLARELRPVDSSSSGHIMFDKDKGVSVQVLVRCKSLSPTPIFTSFSSSLMELMLLLLLFRPLGEDEARLNMPIVISCNEGRREVSVVQNIANKQTDRTFAFEKYTMEEGARKKVIFFFVGSKEDGGSSELGGGSGKDGGGAWLTAARVSIEKTKLMVALAGLLLEVVSGVMVVLRSCCCRTITLVVWVVVGVWRNACGSFSLSDHCRCRTITVVVSDHCRSRTITVAVSISQNLGVLFSLSDHCVFRRKLSYFVGIVMTAGPMASRKASWRLRIFMDSASILEMNTKLQYRHRERLNMTPFKWCMNLLNPIEVNLKLLKEMVQWWVGNDVSFRVCQQLVPFNVVDVFMATGLDIGGLDVTFDQCLVGLVGDMFYPRTTTKKDLIQMFHLIVGDEDIEVDVVYDLDSLCLYDWASCVHNNIVQNLNKCKNKIMHGEISKSLGLSGNVAVLQAWGVERLSLHSHRSQRLWPRIWQWFPYTATEETISNIFKTGKLRMNWYLSKNDRETAEVRAAFDMDDGGIGEETKGEPSTLPDTDEDSSDEGTWEAGAEEIVRKTNSEIMLLSARIASLTKELMDLREFPIYYEEGDVCHDEEGVVVGVVVADEGCGRGVDEQHKANEGCVGGDDEHPKGDEGCGGGVDLHPLGDERCGVVVHEHPSVDEEPPPKHQKVVISDKAGPSNPRPYYIHVDDGENDEHEEHVPLRKFVGDPGTDVDVEKLYIAVVCDIIGQSLNTISMQTLVPRVYVDNMVMLFASTIFMHFQKRLTGVAKRVHFSSLYADHIINDYKRMEKNQYVYRLHNYASYMRFEHFGLADIAIAEFIRLWSDNVKGNENLGWRGQVQRHELAAKYTNEDLREIRKNYVKDWILDKDNIARMEALHVYGFLEDSGFEHNPRQQGPKSERRGPSPLTALFVHGSVLKVCPKCSAAYNCVVIVYHRSVNDYARQTQDLDTILGSRDQNFERRGPSPLTILSVHDSVLKDLDTILGNRDQNFERRGPCPLTLMSVHGSVLKVCPKCSAAYNCVVIVYHWSVNDYTRQMHDLDIILGSRDQNFERRGPCPLTLMSVHGSVLKVCPKCSAAYNSVVIVYHWSVNNYARLMLDLDTNLASRDQNFERRGPCPFFVICVCRTMLKVCPKCSAAYNSVVIVYHWLMQDLDTNLGSRDQNFERKGPCPFFDLDTNLGSRDQNFERRGPCPLTLMSVHGSVLKVWLVFIEDMKRE